MDNGILLFCTLAFSSFWVIYPIFVADQRFLKDKAKLISQSTTLSLFNRITPDNQNPSLQCSLTVVKLLTEGKQEAALRFDL